MHPDSAQSVRRHGGSSSPTSWAPCGHLAETALQSCCRAVNLSEEPSRLRLHVPAEDEHLTHLLGPTATADGVGVLCTLDVEGGEQLAYVGVVIEREDARPCRLASVLASAWYWSQQNSTP